MEKRKAKRIVYLLLKWYAANARDLPWRRTRDPYAIWVSEIMLQQTQVKTVLPYWERWMTAMPDARRLARARSQTLHKLWEGLGYYSRVRNMQKAARVIVEQHGGKFPEKFEEVLALPGVGKYTAGAICSIAFNQPTPIVDGNVARVLTRVFGVKETRGGKDQAPNSKLPPSPRLLRASQRSSKLQAPSSRHGTLEQKLVKERLWGLAEELVMQAAAGASDRSDRSDGRKCSMLNQSLMELGALICTPRKPKCVICPVRTQCTAFRENRVEEYPVLGKRQRATQRRFVAVALERKGDFFVRQRPMGVVNGQLWEFPNVEVGLKRAGAREAKRLLGGNGAIVERFCTIKHSITRYRITLEVFRARGGLTDEWGQTNGKGRWASTHQLQRLPFASAHKKVLERVIAEEKIKGMNRRKQR